MTKPDNASSSSSTDHSDEASSKIYHPQDGQHHHHYEELIMHEHGKHHTPKEDDYNIFRDSWVRYLGYANEVGESFRYQVPKLVGPTYLVAFGYCVADAVTTGQKTYNFANKEQESNPTLDAGIATIDTLLWQSLASVCLPGFAIHQLVKGTRYVLQRVPITVPVVATTWLPTCIGLGSIPLIIHPIDTFVDTIMDNSYRIIPWENYFGDDNNKKNQSK